MEELVRLVSEKTGISQAQAQQAVQFVVDYLCARLPSPVADQIKAEVGGTGSGLGGLAQGLGLFGKK